MSSYLRYRFGTIAQRDAQFYKPDDVFTYVQVTTGTRLFIILTVAPDGTATFFEFADDDPGSLSNIWFPVLPPASPSALDDEFNIIGALNGKWTHFKNTDYTHASIVDGRGLQFSFDTNTNEEVEGWYQTLPDSEYAVYTYVSLVYRPYDQDRGTAGLLIAPSLATPSTAHFDVLGAYVDFNPTRRVISSHYNAYNSIATTQPLEVITGVSGIYLRMRVNGTAYEADVSDDGIGWANMDHRTLGFTPVNIGFCGQAKNTAGFVMNAYFKFFRYFGGAGTSGFDSTHIGKLS